MEGRAIIADFDDATGRLTVHVACQGVHLARSTLSTRLGLDPTMVRVVAEEVGGSFGLKMGNSREEIACAAVAVHLGRPLKWVEDRYENLAASGQAREESFDVEVAVGADRIILALKVRMLLDSGAYPGMGHVVSRTMQSVMPGPYRIEGLSFEETVAITNKASYVAYRGPWAAETFVRERLVDMIAAELGVEPLELRLRNVVDDGDPPPRLVTGRSLRGTTSRQSLERIGELVDVPAFRRRQAAARGEGRHLGLGMATFIEAAPGPRGGSPLGAEHIRAQLHRDGTVSVFTGQMPHGQGHQTTLAQIAADELGVAIDVVRIVVGDTDLVPTGFTGGSRSATFAGGASLTVARALRAQILDLAGHLLEASVDDLELIDGMVAVRGVPASAMSLRAIADAASEPGRIPAGLDASLDVSVVYDGGAGGWSGGTHCAEVEVDPETGLVTIHRYVVVEDCGVLINPSIVEGQVRGGVAQGIGAVLLEHSGLRQRRTVPRLELHGLPPAHDDGRPEDRDRAPRDDPARRRRQLPRRRRRRHGGCPGDALCNAIADAPTPFGAQVVEQHLPPGRDPRADRNDRAPSSSRGTVHANREHRPIGVAECTPTTFSRRRARGREPVGFRRQARARSGRGIGDRRGDRRRAAATRR